MRKNCIMMVTIVLFCLVLTGCNNWKNDETHATVAITTSNGQAYVGNSINGAGMTLSGHEAALKNKAEVILKKGESATVTFKCDACENQQEYEVKEAWAEILSCDCPEHIDEKGNAKEYVAITISFKE